MKARDVIGAKIVKVNQELLDTTVGPQWCIRSIYLDDGRAILFMAVEREDTPAVHAFLVTQKAQP